MAIRLGRPALHRKLVVRDNHAGDEVGVERIDNSPMALAGTLADAGPNPEVAIQATCGWYWASMCSKSSRQPSIV